jgi:hypothetical protein
VVIQKSKRTKCIVVHKDKLKPCFKDTPNKSEEHAVEDTQPPMSSIAVGMFAEGADPIGGDSGSLPNIPEVERSSRRVDPWEQQEACINDFENTRPRRTVRQPKHFSDYVVCPVYRVSSVFSDMSAKEVEMARARSIICEACGRRFQDRHGLKYHLQHFPGNWSHAEYARRQLDNWRNPGRPWSQDTRTVRLHETFNRREEARSTAMDVGTASTFNSTLTNSPSRISESSRRRDPGRHAVFIYTRDPISSFRKSSPHDLSETRRDEDRSQRRQSRATDQPHCSDRGTPSGHRGTSSDGSTIGPSRTFHQATWTIARTMLNHPGELHSAELIQLVRRSWPKLTGGQERAAAAATFHGLLCGIQAAQQAEGFEELNPHSLKSWLQRANRAAGCMRLNTIAVALAK